MIDKNKIKKKFVEVQRLINQSCEKSKRSRNSVRLLVVTKTISTTTIKELIDLGHLDFGENYIREGQGKILELKPFYPAINWHCIGAIQSNKTKIVAENFNWVQSLDRLKIAERLSNQRPENLKNLQVCIQVNIDNSLTKSGCSLETTLNLAKEICQLPRLTLRGIMAIPDIYPTKEETLKVYKRTKDLFEELKNQNLPNSNIDTLSLGMSADLELAIESGSTMVRIGSAIFGARK